MSQQVYWCEMALVGGAVSERVAINVAAGRIGSITANIAPPPGAVKLAGLTIPGLANTHSHAFHRVLRSRTQADSGSFWTWRDLMYQAAERLGPDSYYRLARATFAEMAVSGIAVVGEFHYLHHQANGVPYDNANAIGEALLAAAADVGIRITLLDTLYLYGGLTAAGYAPAGGVQRRYCDASADAWINRVDQLDLADNQRLGAAIHSVRAVDPDSMTAVSAWAASNDLPLHAHVSEQQGENVQCVDYHGVTPTALLEAAGALGPRFTAVHATHLSDADLISYANSGSTVCLCPTTERDLGDGIGPSGTLAEAAVRLALGTDSQAVIDMFEEARAVELDERLRSQQRGIHAAADLLAMATRNGHASLGWNDAGSIEVNARADLVTISLASVRTAGATVGSALETAVFAASAADVTQVMVDGIVIASEGRHASIDVAAELTASITELLAS